MACPFLIGSWLAHWFHRFSEAPVMRSPAALCLRCSLLLVIAAAPLQGEETSPIGTWAQFRGPNASGIAVSAEPPVKIGPSQNVLWVKDVPFSPSSPIVWGEKIFLTTFDQNELQTRCYDRASGELLWSRGVQSAKLETFHGTDGSPAASTPVTDGKHVASYFGSFGLVCYDVDGKELWRRPMGVARSAGNFGTGVSPILAGSTLLLLRDELGPSSLLAVDIATGALRWQSPRPTATGSFGTPILWNHQGSDEVVTPGSLELKGYSLETGAELWSVSGLCPFACTTPVLGPDKLYFGAWCSGGTDNPWPEWEDFLARYDPNQDGKIELNEFPERQRDFLRGIDVNEDGLLSKSDLDQVRELSSQGENLLVAIEPGGRGDITETHVAWTFDKGLPYVPSPLFYQDRIYLVRDGGILSSVDADTGEAIERPKRVLPNGSYYASPVTANGHLYFASLPGVLSVVEPAKGQSEVIHEADFGERIFATPALVERNLYLRTETKLYAFGH